MSELTSINDPLHILFGNRKIASLTKVRSGVCHEWRGETDDGEYILARYRSGFLAVGMAETEYEAEDVVVVGTSDDIHFFTKSGTPTGGDIMKFFDWTPVDDDAVFE
jgi:hypothetical protein